MPAPPQTECSVPLVASPTGWVTILMAGILARGSLPTPAFPVSQWHILDVSSSLTVARAASALDFSNLKIS